MTSLAVWHRQIGGVITAIALVTSTTASAQSSMDGVRRWETEADEAHRIADGSARWFNYAEACRGYAKAIELYTRAINALPSGLIRTDADAEYLRGVRDDIARKAYSADAAAQAVCGRPDGPPPSNSNSPSSSTSAGVVDYDFQKAELQRVAAQSAKHNDDAVRRFEAKDFVGACASARLAAEGFDQVAREMKANAVLESAFANPAQLYANAEQAALDRDKFYCAKRR
jgi:hypothetical protein